MDMQASRILFKVLFIITSSLASGQDTVCKDATSSSFCNSHKTSGPCQGSHQQFVSMFFCRKTCGFCENSQISWRPWGPWNSCSATCGHGFQFRSRTCKIDGLCVGQRKEQVPCVNPTPCFCECPPVFDNPAFVNTFCTDVTQTLCHRSPWYQQNCAKACEDYLCPCRIASRSRFFNLSPTASQETTETQTIPTTTTQTIPTTTTQTVAATTTPVVLVGRLSRLLNLNSYDYNTGFNESIWTRFG